MTATYAIPTTSAPRPTGRLRDRLEPVHHAWLRDLRSALERTDERHSDIMARWRAIRYLDTVFAARFERERRDVERLSLGLGSGQQQQLWAAGELVSSSLWRVGHTVGLCHEAAMFERTTGTLVRAVEHWFGMVEAIAGPLSWDDVPSGIRQDLASLGSAAH
jgi:hypothetical protein